MTFKYSYQKKEETKDTAWSKQFLKYCGSVEWETVFRNLIVKDKEIIWEIEKYWVLWKSFQTSSNSEIFC